MRFFWSFVRMLTPGQRYRYFWVQVYFLFAGVVQVVGVASVAPFIALVSKPSVIHTNHVAQAVFLRGGFTSDTTFLVTVALVLMGLIIASNAVLAGAVWLISAYSLHLGVEIQRDIYFGFLRRDYVTFARTNSATLVTILMEDTMRFVFMVVQPLLNLTSQAVIVALIVLGLLWYDPRVAIIAGLLVGGGYAAVFAVVRHQLQSHGEIISEKQSIKYRLLNESLGGIKEIRLLGTERAYEERFHSVNVEANGAGNIVGLLADLPRFILEPTALCALLSLGVYLLLHPRSTPDIVGVLSLYAMAGYKLLPAAQAIFKASATIRANGGLLKALLPHIEAGRVVVRQPRADAVADPTLTGDIVLENVWYQYPGTDAPVLRNVNLQIPRNQITVFVGRSGSGKSTIADLLLGLLSPTSGRILVGDTPIADRIQSWQRSLGYVPQSIFLLDDTVTANISFGTTTAINPDKVRRAAALANIGEFVESLPEKYDYVVGERGAALSGGQRQRIGIARALYHDADVLVLDEATSALDSGTEREVSATLSELSAIKTIIMVAHRLSTIRAADLVVLVSDGEIRGAGSFDELMENCPEFRDVVAAGHEEDSARATAMTAEVE